MAFRILCLKTPLISRKGSSLECLDICYGVESSFLRLGQSAVTVDISPAPSVGLRMLRCTPTPQLKVLTESTATYDLSSQRGGGYETIYHQHAFLKPLQLGLIMVCDSVDTPTMEMRRNVEMLDFGQRE